MKREEPLQALTSFLPPGSFEHVIKYLHTYKVQLTITRSRKTVLGDYRHTLDTNHHKISINGDLNPYAFLITLLHELAHLLCYNMYGNKIQAHGTEWKSIYADILSRFVQLNIFPEDIEIALQESIQNPAASSCREVSLMKVLHHYDKHPSNIQLLEDLPTGALFSIKDGRLFKKGEKLRKRFKCTLIENKKLYLFSPIHKVQLMEDC